MAVAALFVATAGCASAEPEQVAIRPVAVEDSIPRATTTEKIAPATTAPPPPAPTTTSPPPPPPTTAPPTTTAPPAPQTSVAPEPAKSGNCSSAYPDVCIPPAPPDLDCGEVSHRRFRVVEHPDPHGFDADNDGVGCES